ncbi:apiosidase-like domain-containing protein [Streptomyces fuscichromogenes]|uniref:DUF4038 domain-containing protein n=1 Tax=Streptomyces fuscichromogenes TaxID=1324013 RepID=A0A917XF31_9ACTN|nr:DUF4038 domain-containing protein [Streptomyces fuscichromogenes]GGN17786.1 hypothetical protein GCM10011578_046850 [Streptomyces fuscichromogenes]
MSADRATEITAWRQTEIVLTGTRDHANPYTDVDVWAEFTHESGRVLRRPAFWDGGRTWRIRFASPEPAGRWTWRSGASDGDPGLAGRTGTLTVRPADADTDADTDADASAGAGADGNPFHRHGFWQMSPGGRSLVHADGTPALLVGDTAWALPWRATAEQTAHYAADRRAKGFNAALLMSVQPDMDARGPRDRTADEGFDVGFEDLPTGHVNVLNPAYFQYLDRLTGILRDHGIVPVLQPLFHGFGWKGLRTAGPVVPPQEYARYCRYLVARYGAAPVVYLVGADGEGGEPQIAAGGAEVGRWDAYGQPCGIHYRPHSANRAHQGEPWLHFQWCQTGHMGGHVQERVADMWRNTPAKAVANGEPTYEDPGADRATGWWQGHEAWSNLCAGGTMGVVYGAASLWQWRLHPAESGHTEFFLAKDAGWREALDFEGSRYVGLVGRILDGLPLTDMRPDWCASLAPRGLSVPGVLYVCYAEEGGPLRGIAPDVPLPYRVVDPRTGETVREGVRADAADWVPDEGGAPRVYICHDPDRS